MSFPRVTLWNHVGTSDKIYKMAIEESGDGHVLNFAYGRRGSTLRTGTKTQQPVPLDKATKMFEKILKEQLSEGYEVIEGDPATPTGVGSSVVTDVQQQDTGLRPQLLTPASEDDAEAYLTNDDWAAQEKFNGKRMTIRKAGNDVIAANKKGLSIGYPDAIAAAVGRYMSSFVADGEAVGDVLNAFDLLELNGTDLRSLPYSERLEHLKGMLGEAGKAVVVARTAVGTAAKRKLMADLKNGKKEGIVFKSLSAPWHAGRANSGAVAVKVKFWESCSCVVLKANAKRSVEVGLDGQSIGKVTIPPNKDVPAVGQVIEVEYLYIAKAGGSLYQPKYIGVRDDVDPSECTFAQQNLKITAGGDEDEAA